MVLGAGGSAKIQGCHWPRQLEPGAEAGASLPGELKAGLGLLLPASLAPRQLQGQLPAHGS